MQTKHLIVYIKYNQNFFVLELATLNKAIQITEYSQSNYLVSKNRKIRVWNYRFGYASNAKIIKPFKFLIDINNFNKVYNLNKMYSNSK